MDPGCSCGAALFYCAQRCFNFEECRQGGRVCGEAGIWLLRFGGPGQRQAPVQEEGHWQCALPGALPSPRGESGVLLDHLIIKNLFMAEAGRRGDVTGVEFFQDAVHWPDAGCVRKCGRSGEDEAGFIHKTDFRD